MIDQPANERAPSGSGGRASTIGMVAALLLLAPLAWGYRALVLERREVAAFRNELEQWAYMANVDRQREQTEGRKAVYMEEAAAHSRLVDNALRDENVRLRGEVARLAHRVAELEAATAAGR